MQKVSEDDYLIIETDDEGTIRYYSTPGVLHRNKGPAVIWKDGSEAWYKYGKRHRNDDKPAMTKYINGEIHVQFWYKNGVYSRSNGLPAIVFASGTCYYYVNGKIQIEEDCYYR